MSVYENFRPLGLSDTIISVLEKKGFEKPSSIQERAIPILLNGTKDIVGQSQTGTGKTAAFGLPILEMLEPGAGHIQALILTPTRELALQVTKELQSFMGDKFFRVVSVYGGQSIDQQCRDIKRGADIIVGTPGRMIDHLKNKGLNLSKLAYLVLDEADEMLNVGFKEELEEILASTPESKRTVLFSATMPKFILKLAENYMHDYELIKSESNNMTTSNTDQSYVEVRESDKLGVLCRIMDSAVDFYGIVFCKTKRDVDKVAEQLIRKGYAAEGLHGDLSQNQRERTLAKFKNRNCTMLIVTDVASRGLDINDLSHVVNYSLPQELESYVHRIGRTGRAGKSGIAISFVSPSERGRFIRLQKMIKKDIRKMSVPTVDSVMETKRAQIEEKVTTYLEKYEGKSFDDMAAKLIEGCGAEKAVAALLALKYGRQMDPKQYSEIGKVQSSDRRDRDRDKFRDRDRGDRGQRRERGFNKKFERNGRTAPMHGTGDLVRFFVAKGRQDQMTPRTLVEFIEKKSNVYGRRIDQVQILDKFSFFTVSSSDSIAIEQAFRPQGRERSLVEVAK